MNFVGNEKPFSLGCFSIFALIFNTTNPIIFDADSNILYNFYGMGYNGIPIETSYRSTVIDFDTKEWNQIEFKVSKNRFFQRLQEQKLQTLFHNINYQIRGYK